MEHLLHHTRKQLLKLADSQINTTSKCCFILARVHCVDFYLEAVPLQKDSFL